jgi:hypothetical protein
MAGAETDLEIIETLDVAISGLVKTISKVSNVLSTDN